MCIFVLRQFVQVMFWTLFLINRDLIYPASLDKIIPPFINHSDVSGVHSFDIANKIVVFYLL
jgi:hypothetical protein